MNNMTSTTFTIEGYKVVRTLGVVRGISVGVRNPYDTKILSEQCKNAWSDALNDMMSHALEVNANAVVGLNYISNVFSDLIIEVMCYGTAVVVEKE